MKEVYVVTYGTYSDYGIDCIFTDLEKANKYVKLQNNGGSDDYRIETYPLDQVVIDSVKIIKVYAEKELNNDDYKFKYEIVDVINEDFNINRTRVSVKDYSHKKSSNITLRRKFKGDEIGIVNKYKKVVEDYFFKIESNWDIYKSYEGEESISADLEKDINII
ncbi:hypothetical protein FJQ98_15925 [Lysinibacillus agricola]|uniref:Uncharacterized protein n=1 Tax=Lysinibacillus agricola TaxID=2590012 RepID=A0ABX7ALG5_9BACI|nr:MULTISPECIES: hypothetical protein [Lysinibacillus]KOS61565.1 hypothetical protein AN161_18435 [Lysinibacillus sp. FJAT-14222]QQP10733.1 hypothetical protein FJQ98_15925 [Lysinibacillus agricola]